MIEDFSEHAHSHPARLGSSALQLPKHAAITAAAPQWSPYKDNGGTTAAIAGQDFVVVAGDTRLNGDFCVHTSSDTTKLFQLTNKTFLATNGMQADRLYLQQMLRYRIQWYKYNNAGAIPSTNAIARLLSVILYGRRFFPLYTFNMIVGLDDNGKGVCYSYDAVGSTEPLQYGTNGTSQAFIEPLFDCLIKREHMTTQAPPDMTLEETLNLLKTAFTAAAERDIFTGSSVQLNIITKDGVRVEELPLRKD